MTVGESIRRARERAGWDQARLAAEVGVSRTTVSNWETGISSPRNKLGKLYEVLGLDDEGRQVGPATPKSGPTLAGAEDWQLLAELANRLAAGARYRDSPPPGDPRLIPPGPPPSTPPISYGPPPDETGDTRPGEAG